MEPKEACAAANVLADSGDLQGAVDLLDPVISEFKEFGPAYLVHAKVFLLAGDTQQAMIDLDAAEWSNAEYGSEHQQLEVTELRSVAHAVRTLYGGQREADKCRECVEKLISARATPHTWWFLPAACYELDYRAAAASEWVEKLLKFDLLKSAGGFYFTKRAGLTQLMAMPKDPSQLVPVHYARHYRVRRDGDKKAAEKHLKRMLESLEEGSLWRIVIRYAQGKATVDSV